MTVDVDMLHGPAPRSRRNIETDRAPSPNGHYSQAVEDGGLIFVSMQLPMIPGGHGEMPTTLEAQTEQVIVNCDEILKASGSDLYNVLNATIFLANVADWHSVDTVFARAFGSNCPARGMVPVPALHLGARVAMQMIATSGAEGLDRAN